MFGRLVCYAKGTREGCWTYVSQIQHTTQTHITFQHVTRVRFVWGTKRIITIRVTATIITGGLIRTCQHSRGSTTMVGATPVFGACIIVTSVVRAWVGRGKVQVAHNFGPDAVLALCAQRLNTFMDDTLERHHYSAAGGRNLTPFHTHAIQPC